MTPLKSELDDKTFRQEYEASFETAAGRVYYCFDREQNKTELTYQSEYPLYMVVDFNVNPMCWEFIHPIGDKDYIFDEIVKQNTNTEEMCKAVGDRFGYGKQITVYGDYSGTFRSTNSMTTDYQIMKQILPNVNINVKPNPPVIDRVNAFNSRLKNTKDERRIFVNIKNCPHLVKDLEQVIWMEGKREIDKRNLELTHSSDGVGYYQEYEHSLKGRPVTTHWNLQ